MITGPDMVPILDVPKSGVASHHTVSLVVDIRERNGSVIGHMTNGEPQ